MITLLVSLWKAWSREKEKKFLFVVKTQFPFRAWVHAVTESSLNRLLSCEGELRSLENRKSRISCSAMLRGISLGFLDAREKNVE